MVMHILLPTDGSPLSEAAVRQGIQFAKGINAKVTGFYVVPEFHVFTYRTEMLEGTKGQLAKDGRTHARQYLRRRVTIWPNGYALKADLACGKRARSERAGRYCVGIEQLAGMHCVCPFAAMHRALGSSLVNLAILRRA